jgi:excisionase family DNA binding protein
MKTVITSTEYSYRADQEASIMTAVAADSADDLLGVRETARRLGVHENTVRNWEASGLLTAVRLPTGSRWRRFLAADVARLQHLNEDGRLEQARATHVGLTRQELGDLLAVARMYLDAFAASNPESPGHRQLYQNVTDIVRRYGGEE